MKVKTADLKNNLSRYLRRIRKSGETLIVCERDEPIATLAPLYRSEDAEWHRQREEALERGKQLGIALTLPAERPTGPCLPRVEARAAPDGRTDVKSVQQYREDERY